MQYLFIAIFTRTMTLTITSSIGNSRFCEGLETENFVLWRTPCFPFPAYGFAELFCNLRTHRCGKQPKS